MDPEFITQDGSMSDAKMKNEEVALVGTGIAGVTSGTQPHQDEYIPMPLWQAPNGDRYIRGNDQTITYSRNEFTITTACEHPEVAMRWADCFATDDISVQSYWGPYGVVLEKQDDGQPSPSWIRPKARLATSGTGRSLPRPRPQICEPRV